jgi:hypothetical protein
VPSVPAIPLASTQVKSGGLIDYTKQQRDTFGKTKTLETKRKFRKVIVSAGTKTKVSPKASSQRRMSKSLSHLDDDEEAKDTEMSHFLMTQSLAQLDLDGEEERIAEFFLPIRRRREQTRPMERSLLVAEYERRSSLTLTSQGNNDESHVSRKSTRRQSCSFSSSIISSILRGMEVDTILSKK